MGEDERDLQCVLLGSGGWMPTPQRATSSLLVVRDHDALLLDAGTGVAALARQPELLGEADRLSVVLSHFHLDHVIGVSYLPPVADRADVTIWAPGRLLGNRASSEILRSLIGPPYFSLPVEEFARVGDVSAGVNEIGTFSVEVRVQPFHPGESVGLRLGDDLAYCTDTAPDPDCAAFVRGVSVLLHEAWTDREPTQEHSSAESAAQTAAAAQAGRLVLSHINPLVGDPAVLLAAAQPFFANTEVGYDGQAIHRGRPS